VGYAYRKRKKTADLRFPIVGEKDSPKGGGAIGGGEKLDLKNETKRGRAE